VTYACDAGQCSSVGAPPGTALQAQVGQDCKTIVCDGSGGVTTEPNDADVENDGNDCTVDTCDGGSVVHTPVAAGAACTGPAGAKVCSLAGVCVQCNDPTDCVDHVCTSQHTCAAATCSDGVMNGLESDVDCGGTCAPCVIGQTCNGPTDCATNACGGGPPLTCQPTCADGIQDQDETDVDCGGPICAACGFGQTCQIPGDCATGACTAGTCGCVVVNDVVILSEVKWRGVLSASDEFVELYNPGDNPVTLTSSWSLEWRSETAASYGLRWTGANQIVPPHGHFLIAGSLYSGSAPADAALSTGIADEGSVVLKNNGAVQDAVCWNCGTNSFSTHTCEGGQLELTGCASANDRSIERRPGGGSGNCVDTGVRELRRHRRRRERLAAADPSEPAGPGLAPDPLRPLVPSPAAGADPTPAGQHERGQAFFGPSWRPKPASCGSSS
jgi:hypothetical protein